MAAARRLPQPAQAARPSRNRRPGSPGHQLNGPSAGRHRAHPPSRSPVTAQDASESCKTPPPGLPGESTHRGPTRPILTRAPRSDPPVSIGLKRSRRFSPYGDVTLAVRGEGAAVPIGESVFEFQSGQLRHEVALGRPDVAEVPGAVTRGPVGLAPVVVRRALLRAEVVGVEHDVAVADAHRYGWADQEVGDARQAPRAR